MMYKVVGESGRVYVTEPNYQLAREWIIWHREVPEHLDIIPLENEDPAN